MKRLRQLLWALVLISVFANTNIAKAEGPIEISSFEDLKFYIEVQTDSDPLRPASFPEERLGLQANEYVLTKDIVIDENDQWFVDHGDKLEGGLFSVKGGDFVFDGQGHTITMKGMDGKSHSLFNIIQCDGDYFYRIKNLTINYENDVLGNGLAYILRGEFKRQLDQNTGLLKSGINDLEINVKGSILPIYASNGSKAINNNVAYKARSWNIANGLAAEVYWSDFENITIKVEENIGSEDLGDKPYDVGISNGFTAIHYAEYTSNPDIRAGLADITKENLQTFDWSDALRELGKAGRSKNISIQVGGSIIASAYNDVVVNGYGQINDSVNEKIDINVKGDLKAIQNSGGSSNGLHETSTDGISVLALDNINFLKDAQVNIAGKILWENKDAEDLYTGQGKRISRISTGVVNDTTRDNFNVYQNVHVKVVGGIDVKNPLTPKGLVFDGGHANEWSSNKFYDHTILANNSVKTGDIILACDKEIKFNGIFNRVKAIEDGKNLVIDDHQADFGNITLKSDGMIYGGLVGYNSSEQAGILENIRVSAKDIKIESRGYTLFSGGVGYNNNGLKNIHTRMGNLDIKGNRVVFGGLAAYNYGEISNSSADIKSITIDGKGNFVDAGGAAAVANGSNVIIDSVSAFVDDGIKINNAKKTRVGGFVGYLKDGKIINSSAQIGQDIEATESISGPLLLGGFAGHASNGDIQDSTSLVFGDISDSGESPRVGGFVGYVDGESNISKNASFLGGKLSSLDYSGLFAGYVSNGKIENNTLLSAKAEDEYKVEQAFAGYIPENTGATFTDNKYVFVQEKDRIAYPLEYDSIENNKAIFKKGDELGKIAIAKRAFQADYWEELAELEMNSFPYTDIPYIIDRGGKELIFFTPDSQKLIANGDGSVVNYIPDYFTRHLSTRDEKTGVVYDIWGIRGGDFFIEVTFDENYSEGEIYSKDAEHGQSLGEGFPSNPQRLGYTFLGWNTSKDGTGDSFDKNTVVVAPITVYAQWEIAEDIITHYIDENYKDIIPPKQGEHPRIDIEGYNYIRTEKDNEGNIFHIYRKKSDTIIPGIVPGATTRPISDTGLLNKVDHKAYMFGYPDWTFMPNREMTRAESTVMFARLLENYPTEKKVYEINYLDINITDWYYEAVGFMSENNIVEGYEDGTFKPNAPITRAEFATMASRFDDIVGGRINFTDINSDYWAYSYIASAANRGWVEGYPDGTFRPNQAITRAEVVTVSNRMLNRKADEKFVDENKVLLLDFTDLDESHWAYYNIMEATNGHDYNRFENGVDELWYRLNGEEFRFAVIGYE